jgi:hypothetical protein
MHDSEHDTPAPEPKKEIRRPGPHGAAARNADDEEAISRAYRRAEKDLHESFEVVHPRTVHAAEAVTSLDGEAEETESRGGLKSRACFIATAAYGDASAPEVEVLRRFRDRRLLTNRPGAAFVRLYYRLSPPLARLIARKPRLRTAVRRTLDFISRRAASL